MDDRPSLAERKRLQARDRIVRAAEDLFAERGFAAVSVAEIADRADVGRTTFFRYFGDKQEVVFAQEQDLLATIASARSEIDASIPSTLQEAISQLSDIVVALCARATQDPMAFSRHCELVESNPELRAREALKMQQFSQQLAEILVSRGADSDTAVLASQIAQACYQTARARVGNDPRTLAMQAQAAFEETLNLGCSPRP
ncbi:MAG: TetR family transcriptional regulator [Solirubrobacterales bacterium]|nr:TetR family transcriptional regulator [Solirubrobacterales bacterium]